MVHSMSESWVLAGEFKEILRAMLPPLAALPDPTDTIVCAKTGRNVNGMSKI
jgi:hypothetical protein